MKIRIEHAEIEEAVKRLVEDRIEGGQVAKIRFTRTKAQGVYADVTVEWGTDESTS